MNNPLILHENIEETWTTINHQLKLHTENYPCKRINNKYSKAFPDFYESPFTEQLQSQLNKLTQSLS